ncbi:hypothetical protein [Prescottella equi]|uniref:hypothetical protein n=1 Tax=Rhodococcus hoagii TaxID=43767 RepID=UPI001EEBF0FF|nr:hypothetical protein [Prescottella equi]
MPWPQRLKWGWLVCAFLMVALSVMGIVVSVTALIRGEWSLAAGLAGAAVLFAGLGWIGIGAGGIHTIGLSRRIMECTDEYGRGIRIPTARSVALVFVVALGGAGVYGLGAAGVFYLGDSSLLLPEGRSADGNAALMGILGAVVLLVALCVGILRPRGEVRIYPSGIRRIVRRPFSPRARILDIYRDWTDIEAVIADEMVAHSGGVDVHHPMIKLRTATPIEPGARTKFDSEHDLTIMTKMYVAEPNTLFDLLRYVDENPGSRSIIGASDARELLNPPDLRTRLEIGRRKAAGGSAEGTAP